MTVPVEALRRPFVPVVNPDSDLTEIVILALKVGLPALAVATAIGLPLGAGIAAFRLGGRRAWSSAGTSTTSPA